MTKLERYALVSEIVSGAAIVITIIVLIHEVRTNSGLLQRQIELDRINRFGAIRESDYLIDVLGKIKKVDSDYIDPTVTAFMERYGLSFVEADRWTRLLYSTWSEMQADYIANQRANLYKEITTSLRFPDQVLFWQKAQSGYDPEFVSYVSNIAPDYETVLGGR